MFKLLPKIVLVDILSKWINTKTLHKIGTIVLSKQSFIEELYSYPIFITNEVNICINTDNLKTFKHSNIYKIVEFLSNNNIHFDKLIFSLYNYCDFGMTLYNEIKKLLKMIVPISSKITYINVEYDDNNKHNSKINFTFNNHFKAIIERSNLLRKVKFSSFECDDEFIKLFSNKPYLIDLDLSSNKNITTFKDFNSPISDLNLTNCKKLVNVDFNNLTLINLTIKDCENLIIVNINYENIVHLNILRNNNDWLINNNKLRECKNLKRLSFCFDKQNIIDNITNNHSNLLSLKELYISKCTYRCIYGDTDETIKNLIDKFKDLTILCLRNFDADKLEDIYLEGIAKMKNLTQLNINQSYIFYDRESVKLKLLFLLENLPMLKSFSLHIDNEIINNDIRLHKYKNIINIS
jgi:hypothetical protein